MHCSLYIPPLFLKFVNSSHSRKTPASVLARRDNTLQTAKENQASADLA